MSGWLRHVVNFLSCPATGNNYAARWKELHEHTAIIWYTPVDRFTVESIDVEYVFLVCIRLVRHNCSRHIPVGCRQLSASSSDLRDERLDREPMAVMVPAITASSSTSRCSPWWSDESAKTAVSRPKKRAPIEVSCARARSRLPAGRSFRRDRCSQ